MWRAVFEHLRGRVAQRGGGVGCHCVVSRCAEGSQAAVLKLVAAPNLQGTPASFSSGLLK